MKPKCDPENHLRFRRGIPPELAGPPGGGPQGSKRGRPLNGAGIQALEVRIEELLDVAVRRRVVLGLGGEKSKLRAEKALQLIGPSGPNVASTR